MQAVILAGGIGERLRPLTSDIPKPMVPIGGKPYLLYQIEYLKKQGITDILLLVGYLKEKIIDYFKDGSKFGVSIQYSAEEELLGTGGALKNSESMLEDKFLVIYGDSFLPIDFQEIISFFNEKNKKGLIVVYDNQKDTSVVNNVALNGNMVSIYEKNSSKNLKYVEAGVLMLNKGVLDLIKPGKVSLENEVFPKLISDKELLGFKTTQRFYDIGTKERLEVIKRYLSII